MYRLLTFNAVFVDAFSGCHCYVGCHGHPAMARSSHRHPTTIAPCNGTTSIPKLVDTLPSPHHNTLQWHPAIAPRPQSWSPSSPTHSTPTPRKLVVTLPSNGTLQWHHVHSPEVGRHPSATIASALRWNPAMAPRPLHPAIAGPTSNPPPPIGSKNPYSYRYLQNYTCQTP